MYITDEEWVSIKKNNKGTGFGISSTNPLQWNCLQEICCVCIGTRFDWCNSAFDFSLSAFPRWFALHTHTQPHWPVNILMLFIVFVGKLAKWMMTCEDETFEQAPCSVAWGLFDSNPEVVTKLGTMWSIIESLFYIILYKSIWIDCNNFHL